MKNRARAALAAVACLVALSGCVKIDADLDVNANETVSGKLQLGVDKQLVQASRQSLDQVRQQIESGIKQTSTEGVECKPFEDDRFVGSTCELDKVPFSKMGSSSGEGVSFRKDGDEFVVTVNAGSLNRFPQTGQQAQVKFKITMPGKITSHDQGASVSGRTATYDSLEKLGSVSLRSEAGGGFPLWAIILIIVLLLVAIAAVLYFVRRGRAGGPQPQYPGQYPPGQYPAGQYPPQGQQQWGPQYGTQPGEQPMQYGQPGQPMQYGQPNQPMQYGQPGPGQYPGQPPNQPPVQPQPGQPPQYGQPAPGQYPGQPQRPQGQPPQQGGWGQPPQGQPGPNPPFPGQPPRGNGDGGPEQS